jgi:tetratricopeptide (TPR) repeat protein
MESNANFDKCPYSKQLKEKGMKFPGIDGMPIIPGNHPNISNATEETVDTTFDAEKGMKGQSIELINPNYMPKGGQCPFGMDEKPKSAQVAIKGKCPMGHDSNNLAEESKREAIEKETDSKVKVHGGKSIKDKENSDSEDEMAGGCPVMANNEKKDPANKIFESYYEIPKFGPYDFMFMMRGSLEPEEFFEKTKKIRAMPRHLKYSLFVQHHPNLIKVHEKEFPMVYFVFDDIKRKGDRLYKRKKFREAVEHYTYAYGLLKWVQFKDKTRQENLLKRPSLDPILDDDIDEKIVYLDDIKVEEDSYKASVVYLLNNLSYAYMELRHYTEAIDTLDEALSIAEDKVPDLFFRRSQARACNKFSDNEELEKAMQDIDKAISLKDDPLYHEHKQFLNKIKEERAKKGIQRTERILEKAKKSYQKVKDRHVDRDEIIFCKKDKDALTQYKIMKE